MSKVTLPTASKVQNAGGVEDSKGLNDCENLGERLRDQKTGQSARGEFGGTIFHVISKYGTYQHK